MSVDVAIVGAGVVGASVAWHLRRLGVRNVVLLEREAAPGRGSTGRATGGFRAEYATEVNVRLSLLAREKLRRFRDEVGVDPGYLLSATCGWRGPRTSSRRCGRRRRCSTRPACTRRAS